MKRGRNKKQILIAVIVAIVALIICAVVIKLLPAQVSRFKGMIFWILFKKTNENDADSAEK